MSSKNNKLEEFLSLFSNESNDNIKKRKSYEKLNNSGSLNNSKKHQATSNQFEMFNNGLNKKETNDFASKTLLDKHPFKTSENFFKDKSLDDWNQRKGPNNMCQNKKLLINQSSPKRTKLTQDSVLSHKLRFQSLFSSPEKHPKSSKITLDNNNSQNKRSGPTILSYFKERKKILNSENRDSPRKNVENRNPHNSCNDNFWSQFSISKKRSPSPDAVKFGKPNPLSSQTFNHQTPVKCTPNAREKTQKSVDLKRLVGSKFSEIMVKNRQRQKGIDNYLKSFCESKNDLRNSQASTSWMNLKPSVSQQSCKQTQKVYNKFDDDNFLQPSNAIRTMKTTIQTTQYSDIELFQGSFRKYNSLDHQKSLSQPSNSWLNKPPSWLTPPNSGSERKKGSGYLPFSEGFDKCLNTQLNSNELNIPNSQSLIEQLGPDISQLIKDFTKEKQAPKEKIINFDFEEPAPVNIISANTVSSNGEKLPEKTVTDQNLESNVEEIIDIQKIILGSTFTQTIKENCTQDVTSAPIQNINTETQSQNLDTLKRKHSNDQKKTTKQQKLESTLESTPNTQDYIEKTTLNSQSSDINLESGIVKNFKGYTLKKDSILYGDNLLQELLSDRNVIVKAYEKNMSGRKVERKSEEILTKTCIKRYRKGNMKIYAIRKRYKACKRKNRLFEHTFIDTLQKQIKNNFERTSSSEDEDRSTVSTPCSYLTDDTDALSTVSTKTQLTDYKNVIRKNIDKMRKDENLIFSSFLDSGPKETDSSEILATVHRVILQVLGDYSVGLRPYFTFPANVKNNCVFHNNMNQLRANPSITKILYNRKTVRFNLILFILNKIRLLLETSTKLTKRELFYLLKTMIKEQKTTNNAISDISRMIGVGCWDLNVTAQKGLVYGDLRLIISNGETINCNVPGTLIPIDINAICEVHSNAYFILVVEKESIFHKLLEEDLPNRLPRPFILITGKGFPDLGTQLFLKKLWMLMSVPVLIMVDADPDGISIMLTYRFGSISSAHLCDHLAIPKAKWLGIFPSEISKLDGDYADLTKSERKKVARLLDLECVKSNKKIKQEVEILQDSDTKMGIEGLIKTQTYLSRRYLTSKFVQNDLI